MAPLLQWPPLCGHTGLTVAPLFQGVYFPGCASAVGRFFHRKKEALCNVPPCKRPMSVPLKKQGALPGRYKGGVFSVGCFSGALFYTQKME